MAARPTPAQLDDRLEGIRSAMLADLYEVHIVAATDTRLELRIDALEGACAECLSPPTVMSRIVSSALHGGYEPDEIHFRYPADISGH